MYDGIDVAKGISVFYTLDDASNELFSKALETPDLKTRTEYLTKEIVLRKRILPKIESVL